MGDSSRRRVEYAIRSGGVKSWAADAPRAASDGYLPVHFQAVARSRKSDAMFVVEYQPFAFPGSWPASSASPVPLTAENRRGILLMAVLPYLADGYRAADDGGTAVRLSRVKRFQVGGFLRGLLRILSFGAVAAVADDPDGLRGRVSVMDRRRLAVDEFGRVTDTPERPQA